MKPGGTVYHPTYGYGTLQWIGPELVRVAFDDRVRTIRRDDLSDHLPVIHNARVGAAAAWSRPISKWVM